jgi:hypothetical protein
MARCYIVYADLRLAHGDELVRVRGYGDRIEVLHARIRFFLTALRKIYPLKYAHFLALDALLRRLGLSVILKTDHLCITILGVEARKWVRSLFRFVLAS